ncbi:MAG: restriction endonuclease [Clostridia bacterium]|nr:restriction endonuclease [Clostridia bacterium]
MQVLTLSLKFGNNETKAENRTLEIHINDKYPLEFSIINASYNIDSFEKSNAKLKINSINHTVNRIDYSNDYIVNLYLKFPLNTFAVNDEIVDLTFDEYNKETNNYGIEFTSLSKIEEKNLKKAENDKIFQKILIVIVIIFAFKKIIIPIISAAIESVEQARVDRYNLITSLSKKWESIYDDAISIEKEFPRSYILNEMNRYAGLIDQICQKYKKELEKVLTLMQENLKHKNVFDALAKRAEKLLEEAKNEFSNLNKSEKPIIEKYKQEELTKIAQIECTLEYIDDLRDGYLFEDYTANLLKKMGYINVETTPKSGDFGVDVLAEKDGITYAVQCKLYSGDVGVDAVKEIYAGKDYYKANIRSSHNK